MMDRAKDEAAITENVCPTCGLPEKRLQQNRPVWKILRSVRGASKKLRKKRD